MLEYQRLQHADRPLCTDIKRSGWREREERRREGPTGQTCARFTRQLQHVHKSWSVQWNENQASIVQDTNGRTFKRLILFQSRLYETEASHPHWFGDVVSVCVRMGRWRGLHAATTSELAFACPPLIVLAAFQRWTPALSSRI